MIDEYTGKKIVSPLDLNPISFVTNCYLSPRKGDHLFHFRDGEIFATLDRYAIISCEEYDRLTANQK